MKGTVEVPHWAMALLTILVTLLLSLILSGGLVPGWKLREAENELLKVAQESIEIQQAYRDTFLRYTLRHPCDEDEIIVIQKNR